MSLISHNKRSDSKKSITFVLERDIWEADEVYGSYEKNKVKNMIKSDGDFIEFLKVLKQSTPFYIGSQELKSINKQLKKIQKKS